MGNCTGGLRLLGGFLLGVIGITMLAIAAVVLSVRAADGWGLAAFGWVLLVSGVASLVLGLSDASVRRSGRLEPVLAEVDGEPALYFPRHPLRGAVSAWALAGLAVAPLIGAVGAFTAGRPFRGGIFIAIALLMGWLASPHQVDAGGLWLTPSRLIHRHDGTGWEIGWENVRGAVASDPFGVTVRERPSTRWAVSRLRRWVPTYKQESLWIDGRDMAGDASLRYHLILRSIADPSFRAALGT